MDVREPPVLLCPHCGAENLPESTLCWICHQPTVFRIQPEDVGMAPPLPPQRTFNLSSLMLLIALVAVCFGVTREFPGLGVLLVIVLTPALVRTLRSVYQGKATGQPLTPLQKVETFAVSMVLVSLILLGAGIAFFFTCSAVLMGGTAVSQLLSRFDADSGYGLFMPAFGIGVILGVVAAVAAGSKIARRVWKGKR
ncbi:MAG TPA: hypothetical protein VGZ22_30025 [Isosphaeraceae bacterium]|jgi:hypothetical protein|nr:hypothetical protein [Isosphaeraceae bacterium]